MGNQHLNINNSRWTDEDQKFLEENYDNYTVKELAKILNRKPPYIMGRLVKLYDKFSSEPIPDGFVVLPMDDKYLINKEGVILNKRTRRKLTHINHEGYKIVNLSGNNQYIHRLLAITFIPNPHNKPNINHKDTNKSNNCLSNLEWVTQAENIRHSIETGLKKDFGEGSLLSKLTEDQVLEMLERYGNGEELKTIAKDYNVSYTQVYRILVLKTRWRHLMEDQRLAKGVDPSGSKWREPERVKI